MEEETKASSEVPAKVVDKADTDQGSIPVSVKVEGEGDIRTNGDLDQKGKEGKQEEEETAFDGEFIKVEKEALDVKYNSSTSEAISAEDDRPSVIERRSSNSDASRDFLEAQEKMKELKIELERVTGEFKHSESDNDRLKEEILFTREKLERSEKHCEELELKQKILQEQMIEAMEKHTSHLNTLQEALNAHEGKHTELIDVKDAFDGLSIELENSRKKMLELEQELQSSASEVQKFEQMSKQSGSHAESETLRALEFEKLLEMAMLSAKEMEAQTASLQEELKGLYEKIAENERFEEGLKSTTADLSAVQAELKLSKSHMLELEQRLASKDAVINELTKELDLRKASEAQMKDDILALENQLSSTKEDLRVNFSKLEEFKFKFQEEVNTRELAEVSLKKQETQISSLHEEFSNIIKEKDVLEATVVDLKSDAFAMKELCSDLESKLKQSDKNFCKADSLLAQALSNNAELEQQLKSLEDLHQESGNVAATATQKNLELEEIVQASNEAVEQAQSRMKELDTRLITSEQKNLELEQQLNLVVLKSSDAERELKEFSEKTSELNDTLRGVEEEKLQLRDQVKLYEGNLSQLEASLSQSSLRNSELEMELNSVIEKCAEREGQINATHQQRLELEELLQLSHKKIEDAGRKVGELELLLETSNYRIQELEDQISALETKCGDSDTESKQLSNKVLELAGELEMFQAKTSSLEIALKAAKEKENDLTEYLKAVAVEKKMFEDESDSSKQKLSEAEKLLEVLQNELRSAHEKLEAIENDLKASGIRECDLLEKIKLAEEQLEQQGTAIQQATSRNSELEALHESLARDSELKIQEAIASFTKRDAEAISLGDKLKILDDKVKFYQDQAAQSGEGSAILKAELDESSMKLITLESTVDKLKREVLEAEERASRSFSENELLAETNLQLQSKVNELQELLKSACAEKEAAAEQLTSHMNSVTELTDKHSRSLELQSVTEYRIREAEAQLQEATEKLAHKDLEVKDLSEKLNTLENQIKIHEEQAGEASAIAESQKFELEEVLQKSKHTEIVVEELQTKASQLEKESEGLMEANLRLTQELASYESKMNELQTTLSAVLLEKDEAIQQLDSSKKAIEDLTKQLSSEGKELQSQISSVMEENNLLNETYHNTRKELQTVISQLEGQLTEQKAKEDALNSEIEKLKIDVMEKSVLQTHISELEQKLLLAETRVKEEVERLQTVAAEKEGEILSKLEEQGHKLHNRDILDEQVLQVKKDLDLAHTTISEQKEANSKKELVQEADVKNSFEELEAKREQVLILEKQVEELEQKLHLADKQSAEKDQEEEKRISLLNAELDDLRKRSSETDALQKKIEELESKLKLANASSVNQDVGSPSRLDDGLQVKSRDIGSTTSSPSKRKSKKKAEAASAQTSPSPVTPTQTAEVSSFTTYKFMLGVALVSIIIGIILGKRY